MQSIRNSQSIFVTYRYYVQFKVVQKSYFKLFGHRLSESYYKELNDAHKL